MDHIKQLEMRPEIPCYPDILVPIPSVHMSGFDASDPCAAEEVEYNRILLWLTQNLSAFEQRPAKC